MNILEHRAAVAVEAIETAKTPLQKHLARETGLAVRAELQKQLGDDKALAAFKKAKPQTMAGVWKGDPVEARGFVRGE